MSTSPHRERWPAAGRVRDGSHRRPWLGMAALAFAALSMGIPPSARGDELVLRTSLTLKDKQVSGVDEDGVRLGTAARPIGWDEIAGGTLARDQARFDQLRETL